MTVFPGQEKRKRNSVNRESAVFSFFTDGNSGVHKGVVCATLSRASDLGYCSFYTVHCADAKSKVRIGSTSAKWSFEPDKRQE
jgi:hypothetical protein